MALIELYRITGDKRQLDLAGYILQGDERMQLPEHRTIYMFSGTPFTASTKLEGHAVRAMYACCGATDYYMETGDPAYWKTLNTLWNDMTATKMYVTGGVGSRSDGEAFGNAYELPNDRAYGESCAAIGNMMWNWRMLAATGDAKFTDVIERALYNGINSGMSLDGTLYCYRNPLAFDPATGREDSQSLVRHHLLSAESGAHVCFSARIFLQHQQRRNLRASLRQFGTGLAPGKWRRPEGHAKDKLSVGWHGRNHCHAGPGFEFYFLPANPGMGRQRAGHRERQGNCRSEAGGVSGESSGHGRRETLSVCTWRCRCRCSKRTLKWPTTRGELRSSAVRWFIAWKRSTSRREFPSPTWR